LVCEKKTDILSRKIDEYECIDIIREPASGDQILCARCIGPSQPERADSMTLLKEVSGDQRYILDYLTEEVLRRQPQDIQTFLLSTCILDRLNASLCDAVLQQAGSQKMFQRLEQANLFVVSLDSRREWYRYHALFAEALRYRLQQTHPDLMLALHYRASLWYAEHDRTTQAILHAFHAKEWEWAADLIERKSVQVIAFTWGAGEHEMAQIRQWLKQLPVDIMGSLPRLCVVCTQLLWAVTPHSLLEVWLGAAEAMLTASLTRQISEEASHANPTQQVRQEEENLLGEVIATRAYLWGYQEESGQAVLALCQQALSLLSVENSMIRAQICYIQLRAYYFSSLNDAVAAIQSGLQAGTLAQAAGRIALAMSFMGSTAALMIGTGQLHEAQWLSQQAIQLGTQPGGLVSPDAGWPKVWQAEIQREWNHLDAARSLAEDAVSLCKQRISLAALVHLLFGYAIVMRVSLSCGDYDAASSALQQFECLGRKMNQYIYMDVRSRFITVEEIRLWLACGELDRAKHWTKELGIGKRRGSGFPFIREREEVALARILLAQAQPTLALEKLEPVLVRATTGKRWGHVIEIRLLQALAYQMRQEKEQALGALSEAVRLAELEGYIRSFLDEGAPIEALLYQLRKQNRRSGPTPYLDTLLTAFQQESKTHLSAGKSIEAYQLPESLSERELEVLQLLVRGASNQEIAQELVITIDTVKRHISHIFSKLGVKNRIQAVKQAQELGLLDEER
jgi:LuxR family maltose regulon positive regulatory protein